MPSASLTVTWDQIDAISRKRTQKTMAAVSGVDEDSQDNRNPEQESPKRHERENSVPRRFSKFMYAAMEDGAWKHLNNKEKDIPEGAEPLEKMQRVSASSTRSQESLGEIEDRYVNLAWDMNRKLTKGCGSQARKNRPGYQRSSLARRYSNVH